MFFITAAFRRAARIKRAFIGALAKRISSQTPPDTIRSASDLYHLRFYHYDKKNVLRIRMSGVTSRGAMWDGEAVIPPDDPLREFWEWALSANYWGAYLNHDQFLDRLFEFYGKEVKVVGGVAQSKPD